DAAGSPPCVASRPSARSVPVHAIRPPTSCVCDNGTIPVMLERPFVGLRPNRLCTADGIRIEPQVSDPHAIAAKLAATAAPLPPLEPPGLRSGLYGLHVWPPMELIVVMPLASSCMFDFAMMTAPASRSFFTWNASLGSSDANAIVPADVGIPRVPYCP